MRNVEDLTSSRFHSGSGLLCFIGCLAPSLVSRDVAEVLERIGTTAETWQARLEKLSEGRLLGRFLAASRQRLREVAQRLGLRRAVNLGRCQVT